MIAPAYSQSNTAASFTSATSVSVTNPATVADGEVSYLRVLISSTNVTITWPAGWTEVSQGTQGASYTGGLAWKRMTAADGGASYTVNFSAACTGTSRMSTFTGCKLSGTPHEGAAMNQGTSVSMTSSAIVTQGPNRLGVVFYTQDSTTTSTVPGGWTQQVTGTASGTRNYVDLKAIAAAGTEAAVTRTITSTSWITFSLAVLPEQRIFIV